ncbi:MAG: type II CRISPR RNA-guided endonuclease Cas9, partial [Clostridia bacterium]
MHRCSRRRLERRKQRVRLLRELFTEEIFKVDPSFFERLDESNLYEEDKKTKQSNSLFNDENFTDLNYHRKYPTIYHLRKDLMTTESKPDIRLVYLAVHHIIKYRGHFLFEGILDGDLPQFEGVFAELLNKINDECDFQFNADNIMAEIKEILLNVDTGMSEKVKKLNLSLSADDPAEKEFVKLIVGGKIHTSKLFNDDSEINFSLKDSDFDDKIEEYED